MTKTFPKHDKLKRDIELAKKYVHRSVEIRMEGRRTLEPAREMCKNVAWKRMNEEVK